MRIEQLEYLQAIVRSGSMRRAGEQLHISQAALSEAVRNLEHELGVTVLDRHRSGAKISDAGRALLPFVSGVLDAVQQLRSAVGDHERAARTLRVATVHAATAPVLAPAIRELSTSHPALEVEIVSAQQDHIRESLLDGSVDLGLVNVMAGDPPEPRLLTEELLSGRTVLCCRADHPLARRPNVTVADLLSEPLIFMRSGYAMHGHLNRLLGAHRPAVALHADGAEMGKAMVAEGLGVTVLPDYSVCDDSLVRAGVITYRPLAADIAEDVVLAIAARPGRHRSVSVQALEAALRGQAARRRAPLGARGAAVPRPG